MERTNLTPLVEAELNRRHWRLHLDPNVCDSLAEFVGKVATRLQSDAGQQAGKDESEHVRSAVIYEYGFLMYAAIRHPSSRTQTRVFDEILDYGRRTAHKRCSHPDLAEQALYTAAVTLWKKAPDIKNPGTTLAYFIQVLQNAINTTLRKLEQQKKREVTEVDLTPNFDDEQNDPEGHDTDPLVTPFLVDAELSSLFNLQGRSVLLSLLHKCLKDWRRTFTVVADFFLDLPPQAIAWILSSASEEQQINVNQVYHFKFSALTRLKTGRCPDVVAALTAQIQA